MEKTLNMASDIRAFQPKGHVAPNITHATTIGRSEEKEISNHAFRRILKRAMDLGVSDLAMQHDHYLYGTEKR